MTVTSERHEGLWLPSTRGGSFDDGLHVSVSRGDGVWVESVDGRRFLDANSGLWHLSLGYSPRRVAEAVATAARELGGSSLFRRSHVWADQLIEELVPLVGLPRPRFFFATSGSEGSDAAMRIALSYWVDEGRDMFGYVPGAYHGISLGPLALMGLDGYGNGLTSAIPTVALPSFELWATSPATAASVLREQIETNAGRLAAVFVEVAQGSGGVVSMPASYADCLAGCAQEHGFLLVVDEVATGVYRTGRFLAGEEYPTLAADVLLLGKGLTAGMTALSVVAVAERVWTRILGNRSTERLAGTTHAGNPIACAAAIATLAELARSEVREQRRLGARRLASAMASLKEMPAVERVSGRGHMWGVSLTPKARAAAEELGQGTFIDVVTRLGLDEGLLVHPLSVGVVPVLPALTITESEAAELQRRLSDVLARLA